MLHYLFIQSYTYSKKSYIVSISASIAHDCSTVAVVIIVSGKGPQSRKLLSRRLNNIGLWPKAGSSEVALDREAHRS